MGSFDRSGIKLQIWVLAIVLSGLGVMAVPAVVQAQNAPATPTGAPAPSQANATAPPSRPVAVSAAATPSAPTLPIGTLLQRSGGSLARVQLISQADPATAGPSSASYFSVAAPQPKLVRKHDVVTIVVNEQSTFSSIGTTDLKHSSDLDAQIDSYIAMRLSNLRIAQMSPSTPLELKGSSSHNFKGEATVNRTDALTTQITAEVLDVKPNGTIVLQATTRIKTDDEEQRIVLTGVCRVEDIAADNTVLSTQLSNLDVKKTHTGAVRDTTERGWVPRLLDTINPF